MPFMSWILGPLDHPLAPFATPTDTDFLAGAVAAVTGDIPCPDPVLSINAADGHCFEIGAFPVLVKNRTVAYLVGDAPGTVLSEADRKKLVDAVQKASLAFEVLILRKKILA